jgi:hypothetical protein
MAFFDHNLQPRPLPRPARDVVSDDTLRLARLAVEARKARRGEDVGRWARHLARDVGEAAD